MRIETVTVSPATAQAWLDTAAAAPQRALSKNRVMTYAGQMSKGSWRVTHQPIALDPDGVLIDGQHRLSAVVMSRTTVNMSVAFDVPRETFDVIDTGRARTAASTLHIAGIPDANATAAAARLILTYGEISGTRRLPNAETRQMFSARDVLEFMATPGGESLQGALFTGRLIGQSLGRYGARSWLTAAIALIDATAPDNVLRQEFVERIASGVGLPQGSPLLAFRRWMISEFGYARTPNQYRGTTGVAAVIKAWNAWINGHDLKLMRFRAGKETWPVPGIEFPDALDIAAEDAAADELESEMVDA